MRGSAWSRAQVAQYCAGEHDFVEPPTLRRSAADRFVAAKSPRALGGRPLDTGVYGATKYAAPAPGGRPARLAPAGRKCATPTPMLNPAGRLMGRPSPYEARRWPLLAGWFVLPAGMAPALVSRPPAATRRRDREPLRAGWVFALGSACATLPAALTVPTFPIFLRSWPARGNVGATTAVVARLSLTGELVRNQRAGAAATGCGMRSSTPDRSRMRPIGVRARTACGSKGLRRWWSLRFLTSVTPVMANLDRFVALDRAVHWLRGCASRGPACHRGAVLMRSTRPMPTPPAVNRSIMTAGASATSPRAPTASRAAQLGAAYVDGVQRMQDPLVPSSACHRPRGSSASRMIRRIAPAGLSHHARR